MVEERGAARAGAEAAERGTAAVRGAEAAPARGWGAAEHGVAATKGGGCLDLPAHARAGRLLPQPLHLSCVHGRIGEYFWVISVGPFHDSFPCS